ncbi:MAG: hypothetical protein HZA16_04640 [Nitrospirae bacterium]|nr:hypothetical protein [Nitrospirota bacterium]
MNNILLLYDTQEEDLARDVKDFLNELEVIIEMIPLAPNRGNTLQDKEKYFFDSADGAIFLVTPRTESSPSSSVSLEMGLAKKFIPEKVIYLVEKNCNVATIDQKPHIKFDRNNIRSIIKAITVLIKDLKLAGWFGNKKKEQKIPAIDIAKYAESIDEILRKICFDLSAEPDFFITHTEFKNLLKSKYNMSEQDINFVKIDLTEKGLAQYYRPSLQNIDGGYQLINIGRKLARHEKEQQEKKRASNPSIGLGLLDKALINDLPAISTDYAIPPANRALGLLPERYKRKK